MEKDKKEYHEFDLKDGRHVAFAIIGKDNHNIDEIHYSIGGPIYRMFIDDEHYPGFFLLVENPTRSWDYEVLEQRVREHFENEKEK